MNRRTAHIADLLSAYVAGTLDSATTTRVRAHLADCPACRAELAEWEAIASAALARYQQIDAPGDALLDRVWHVLRGQVPLVRRGIWAASALTMALGCLVELIAPYGVGSVLAVFAPIVAALGVAFVYGPETDPCLEIALATPTSPRLVLLARLTLVYAYDILLALAASVVIAAAHGGAELWPVIVLWLGPMLFLSALSLMLSLLFGSGVGIGGALALWAVRVFMARVPWRTADAWSDTINRFWRNDTLLIPLAAALLLIAVLSLPRQERFAAGAHLAGGAL